MGTWNYHGGPTPLRKGLEAGALFIDTAESYGSEPDVGTAVQGLREQVFIATKISPEHFRPSDVRQAVEGSLQRMGIDYVDLVQLHEPNPAIPLADTLGALAGLIESGKVRFAGVSNFSVGQLQAAQRALAGHPIVSNQVRYNLIDRTIEQDLLPYCRANGITVIAYCPLGRGLDRVRDCDPSGVLEELAGATTRSPAQIVINWCLCQPGVVAIPKGNSTAHVLDNCGASGWRLTGEQLSLLNSRIQFRRRNRFDTIIRDWMPGSLHSLAVRTLRALPRDLRRRLR